MDVIQQAVSAKYLVLLIIFAAFLGGCASHSATLHKPELVTLQQGSFTPEMDEDEFDLEAEFESASAETIIDPLSGYNRLMTQVNDRFYFWLIKPVSQGYSLVIPEPARLGVGRFFRNLLMPVRFANNLLQMKPKRAGIELARFILNSTVGLLGFVDPAANSFGMQAYPEDFGQTLGYYGIGAGFHIVLPLLGPSNLRDTISLIPDYLLSPVSYIDNVEVELVVDAYRQVNHTSLHIGEYESLKKDAVDLYTFFRDGYEQRRVNQIKE
jgi:phospholipid-binding lipoprotein MlaA